MDWTGVFTLVTIGAATLNVGMVISGLRSMRRYRTLMLGMAYRELGLRAREAKFEQRVREAESGKMPDMREYLEEITG